MGGNLLLDHLRPPPLHAPCASLHAPTPLLACSTLGPLPDVLLTTCSPPLLSPTSNRTAPLPCLCSTLGPLPDFLLTTSKNARRFFQVQEEVVADPLTGVCRWCWVGGWVCLCVGGGLQFRVVLH